LSIEDSFAPLRFNKRMHLTRALVKELYQAEGDVLVEHDVTEGSLSGWLSRLGTGAGLGTVLDPFSAHRHIVFQEELSHTTLAHRGEDLGRDVPGAVESLEELQLVSLNAVHATVDDEVESTSWADVA
jgi:hypothetical protein